MIGKTVSHYQIIDKLGEGGMGVVYKARDTHLDRFVAIKTLRLERTVDPEGKRRFVQEAKAASALNHPNIVHVYDIDKADSTDYIAMEYVAGKTLDELILRKGMRLSLALKYAIQIADALARAHGAGIIHRDMKPSNVMVDEHGLVKVLDFGLAKLTEAGLVGDDACTRTVEANTEKGTILGTVAYMSPEQVEGKHVDTRSDIFSFGSMLYEMLTGQRAFRGDTKASTIAAILKEEPKSISQVAEGLPRDLEKLVKRCLQKDPDRRFQHMGDLKIALEELKEESETGKLSAESVADRSRTKWWTVALSLAAVAGVSAMALYLYVQFRSEEGFPPPTISPLTSYEGMELYPSFSPDGNQVAFVWDGDAHDNPDIYIKLIGGAERPLRLTTDPSADLSPAWSPDGRFIAFVRDPVGAERKSSVILVPAIGGPERVLTELGAHLPSSASGMMRRIMPFPVVGWAPTGETLIIADRGSGEPLGLFALSVKTGEKWRLTAAPASYIGDGAPALSPDGRTLIFGRAANLNTCDLYRLPLSAGWQPAGAPERLTHSETWDATPVWLPGGREIIFSRGTWNNGPFSLWRVSESVGSEPRPLVSFGQDSGWPAISAQKGRLVFSRTVSDRNIWRVPLQGDTAAGTPERLISSTRNDSVAQYSPDGTRIVFTSDRSGTFEVWICNSDGSNSIQLTSLGAPMAGSPHWSPDGKRIVFDSNAGGQFDVYVIDAVGRPPRRLTTHPSNDALASFSPDGRVIYFASDRTGSYQVWQMPSSGGDAVQLTHGGGRGPIASPDGRIVYYEGGVGRHELRSVPAGGGQETTLLGSVGFLQYAISERGIYFIARDGDLGNRAIQFFDFAARIAVPVITLHNTIDPGLAVSSDRKFLLYTQVDEAGSDLMLVDNFR